MVAASSSVVIAVVGFGLEEGGFLMARFRGCLGCRLIVGGESCCCCLLLGKTRRAEHDGDLLRQRTRDQGNVLGAVRGGQEVLELGKGRDDVVFYGPEEYALGFSIGQVELHRLLDAGQFEFDESQSFADDGGNVLGTTAGIPD